MGAFHKVDRNGSIYHQAFTYLYTGNASNNMENLPLLDSTLAYQVAEKNKFTSTSSESLISWRKGFAKMRISGESSTDGLQRPAPFLCDSDVQNNVCLRSPHGVWVLVCRTNHSCLPNVCRAIIGNVLIIRASTSIPADTEIYDSYVPITTRTISGALVPRKTTSLNASVPFAR